MARSLVHIPQRIIKAVLLTVLLGVVLFFAATRTEVGRNELRQEIQRQFDDRFAGTLQIGDLQGNLINDLFASDVRLLAPSGRTVLTIDSLVARPRWQSLFSQQLAFRSVTAFRPQMTLHRRADSTWNLQQALAHRDTARTASRSAFDLSLADLRLRDGSLTTTRDGPPPSLTEREWLFDYTQARLDDLEAHGTIEWSPQRELIDIFNLSGTLPDQNLRVQQLRGQILGREDRMTFNEITVKTDATELAFDATLARFGQWTDRASTPEMELDLATSSISFDEMKRLVPRLPLADEATVAAQIRGPLSGLVVEALRVEHGSSHLALEGTVVGLPERVDYEIGLRESRLAAHDVRTLFPSAPIPPLDELGPVALSAYSKGILPFDTDSLNLRSTTELALHSQAGALDGELHLTHRPDQPIDYAGHFRADSLDLAPVTRTPAYQSDLSGRVTIAGRGIDRTSAHGRLTVALDPSSFAGRRADSLQVDLHADAGRFSTDLQLWDPQHGYLHADGELDLLQTHPSYSVTLAARDFDLQTLLLDRWPATHLNGTMTAQGAGFSFDTASGQLAVALDSSSVDYHGQTHHIPPHRTTLTVADRASDEPRLELTGDAATLRVDGDVAFEPLWALGNLWGRELAAALREELDKPYHPPLVSALPSAPAELVSDPLTESLSDDPTARWQARARRMLREAGYSSDLTVQTTFAIKQPEVFQPLLPFFPTLQTDLNGRVIVTAGADQLTVQSHLQSDVFAVQGLSTGGLTVQLSATGGLHAPLAETFTVDLSVYGDQVQLGPVALRTPRLSLDYTNREAALRFESDKNGSTGPFRFAATADLLSDRNELTVHDVHFAAGEYSWTSTQPSTLHAYADALIIPDFLLESTHPDEDRTQRLRVQGAFSASPRDTVIAEASHVLLQPFSELARLERPIGGSLNGTVALTGGWDAPRVNSALDVNWLSFDRRLLGRLQMASRYEVGSPDLLLDATLQSEEYDPDEAPPSYLPYRPQRREENHLELTGRIRLPDTPTALVSPVHRPDDLFDLQFDIERADLFFFEYIFEDLVTNVSGHLTGRGQIRGSLHDPRFSANLQAVDGRFDLPRFNLRYNLEGPISVDTEGIKLHDLSVEGPDEGDATVSGAILFNAYEYFSFDLHADLHEMRIIDVERSQDLPFYGHISASGPVTLTGPLAGATLRTNDARTTPDSELFIPVQEGEIDDDSGFIIFADSTGQIPDFQHIVRRTNILADRPAGEPTFLDALDLDINLRAPQGSTVHLVFDPLLGDVVTAVGSGRIQIQRQEGEFFTYGTLEVNSGEYLFTAGEVFVRRFSIDGGTITWDGNPTNAQLDLDASYRTRASTAGLSSEAQRIPVVVRLDITGRVESPRVGLSLMVDARDRNTSLASEALQSIFNQRSLATEDRATEYATSVLLTNTFLLTTSSATSGQQASTDTGDRLTNAGNQLAFNSVSQLVASQLNRYLNEALPNLDVNLGVQGEDPQDLDVIYGVALRLLDERLIIRGEGIYQGNEAQRRRTEGLEGEFVVEVRLSSNVSVEAFYRRSGDDLFNGQTLTNTTGAGLSYQTEFTTWRDFFRRFLGWLLPGGNDDPPRDAPSPPADTLATDPREQ